MTRGAAASAVLSGALLAASFPALDLAFLAWAGLVPFLLALRGLTPRQGFWTGGLFGIGLFTGALSWVAASLHAYGNLALIPASLVTLLLCAYCALYPALFGAIIARLRATRPALTCIAAPIAWTALEFGRTHILSGFPWALLGYTQYRVLPVIQAADLTGVYGVSFLIVLVNAVIAGIIEERKKTVPALIGIALTGAAFGYGMLRLQHLPQGDRIRISVIQGNIEQDRKWDPAYQAEVTAAYHRLTRSAWGARPDLVIWPETATPFYFGGKGDDATRTEELRHFIRSGGVPLLVGSPTLAVRLRNSAFLLDRTGATSAVYHKLHLVPFGEYVPMKRSLLFFVEKMVQARGDFEPGTEFTMMKIRRTDGKPDVGMGTVICYEIIFPDLVRRFVNKGATVMSTITNDAWFGRTAAPYQHFAMTVFRAVENRVPIARAANTGVSGFIDAQGRILDASGIFTEAVLTRDLVFASGDRTFYTRFGDVFAWICVALTFTLLIPARKRTIS